VRSGLPNQDARHCIVIPGEGATPAIAIAAVSDGHGGARHFRSQIGSSLAVSTAVDVLQGFLSQHALDAGADGITAENIQVLERKLVDHWTAAVSADLDNHPLTSEELVNLEKGDGADSRTALETAPLLAYGATLLVAAATDNLILYLQLGDGEILCVDGKGETTRPLPADARLVANQTTSLCQPDAWREFRAAWFAAPELPALVLLSTDGYANSFRSDDDFLKIGSDYLGIIREQGIATLAEELPEILNEASQQGSGDDITLAILQGDMKKSAGESNGVPVKPKISSESRSALIEQLKVRHSSQHRRLDELSSRLEQTRKDNRRLQTLIVLLVVLVLGAGLYFFRGMFHSSAPPNPELKPGSAAPRGKPAASSPEAPPAKPKAAQGAEPGEWRLEMPHGTAVSLNQGMNLDIVNNQIVPHTRDGGDGKHFARVAMRAKKMRLINDSEYVWSISVNGKKSKIKNGEDVELGTEPIEITFTKGLTGTITPAPPSSGSDDQGSASDQPAPEIR
jgi:serine/threonine protein phosphatase PrpC